MFVNTFPMVTTVNTEKEKCYSHVQRFRDRINEQKQVDGRTLGEVNGQ